MSDLLERYAREIEELQAKNANQFEKIVELKKVIRAQRVVIDTCAKKDFNGLMMLIGLIAITLILMAWLKW